MARSMLQLATKFALDDLPEPDPDESETDFIDRCVEETLSDNPDADEGDVEEACQIVWDEQRSVSAKKVLHKVRAAAKSDGMEFILSDATPDRFDDVIEPNGWVTTQFKRNPIALFNHNADFPVGSWKNVRVENNALRGELVLAPYGTSPRIDELRLLSEAGILKAVSVGFRPLEWKPREESDKGGIVYTKSELVETSLVAIPANPNALAIAKSLSISADTLHLVFAEQGSRRNGMRRRRGVQGEHAETSRVRKNNAMAPSLAQRIQDTQARIVALRDKLNEHLKTFDDSNVTDEQITINSEFHAKIAQEQRTLDSLRASERSLALTSNADDDANEQRGQSLLAPQRGQLQQQPQQRRPFNLPSKKVDPIEFIVRAGTVAMFSHIYKRNTEDVRLAIAKIYPAYGDDATKVFIDLVMRAATAPAMTTVTGWAAELVETVFAAFMETLMPKSVFPRLSGYGLALNFGRAGRISIPTRSRTPTVAGSFVGEGQPIPVRQGAFTAQLLTPKKMAVITAWTREIDEHSVPAIEGLLRQAVQEDTAVSLDSVLLDANVATVVRPAGLLAGVASLPPTAGGGFNAIVGDIKALTGALITGTGGHLRTPSWLMNPQQVNSASLIAAPGVGAFPFRDEIRQGQLQSYPIIDSGTVPMGTVILVDAADFVVVGGDAPRFEVSDQATLHFDDTTPLQIGTPGTPPTVAAPVQSLWQTDSLALRLILPINWCLRRGGVVAWTAGVTW